MTLRPASLAELARQLADCHAAKRPVAAVDLSALAAIRDYTPEDMTVTAEGGVNLAELQGRLAARGQWLPVDPPHAARVTVRQLLAENLSGPRRCGFGTIREHLIGLEAVLADGRIIHSGGKVVKNVAGYDLLKLFVGARDSLGIVTAATFKLRPLPEQELVLTAQFPTLAAAWTAVAALLDSPLTPVALDLHNLAPGPFTVVLTLAGTRAEVGWQRACAAGFQPLSAAPEHEPNFWSAAALVHTESFLPSQLPETLAALGSTPFLARAANGIIHHRGRPRPQPAVPLALARRLKETFDPHRILPEAPL
jgi:glycolate oxidase FAD binding subunit